MRTASVARKPEPTAEAVLKLAVTTGTLSNAVGKVWNRVRVPVPEVIVAALLPAWIALALLSRPAGVPWL
jgi:hypothetical protein